MARKPVPKAIETSVLVQSRRRCCICFGLDRDTRLKAGQIAHLDQDATNNEEGNLAFLCFDHHDAYDSKTSQRKNFTIGEIMGFRHELYTTINKAFAQPVHFGEMLVPPADPYAGTYIRLDCGTDSAEIRLTPLPDSYEGNAQYYVAGLSLFGAHRPRGPNLGTFEFVGMLEDARQIVYRRSSYADGEAVTRMVFSGDGVLVVQEENYIGQYGMGVSFEGHYQRAA